MPARPEPVAAARIFRLLVTLMSFRLLILGTGVQGIYVRVAYLHCMSCSLPTCLHKASGLPHTRLFQPSSFFHPPYRNPPDPPFYLFEAPQALIDPSNLAAPSTSASHEYLLRVKISTLGLYLVSFSDRSSSVPALTMVTPVIASPATHSRVPHSPQKLLVTVLPESPVRVHCLAVPLVGWKEGVGTSRLVECVLLELRRQEMQWQRAWTGMGCVRWVGVCG